MDELILEDYFGHDTEDEFLDWASVQFKEHRDVTVADKSEMVYEFVIVYQDGCCDLCYSENVRVLLNYQGASLVFTGDYGYDDTDSGYELTLYHFRVEEEGK